MNLLRCNSTFSLLQPCGVWFTSWYFLPLNFFTLPFSMSRQPHGALSSGPYDTKCPTRPVLFTRHNVTPCRSLWNPSYFGQTLCSSEKVMSGIPIIEMSMIFPWYSHDIPMIFPWYSLVFKPVFVKVFFSSCLISRETQSDFSLVIHHPIIQTQQARCFWKKTRQGLRTNNHSISQWIGLRENLNRKP